MTITADVDIIDNSYKIWDDANSTWTAKDTFTVLATNEVQFPVDIPLDINLKWDETYDLRVTDSNGLLYGLDTVTLSKPPSWEYITYDGTVINQLSTQSFKEKALADFGITLEAGDLVAIESNAGITQLNADSTVIYDENQLLTGQAYKIWDDNASTWYTGTYDVEYFIIRANLTNPQAGTLAKVDTDTDFGDMYILASTNAVELASNVVTTGESVAVVATGEVSIKPSGRTFGQTYYNHFVQVTDGNNSVIATSSSYLFDSDFFILNIDGDDTINAGQNNIDVEFDVDVDLQTVTLGGQPMVID